MARLGILLFCLLSFPGEGHAKGEPLYIFAAASLTDVINAASDEFERRTGTPSIGVFASSASLARQIQSGSPADLFVSANIDWMRLLENNRLTIRNSQHVVARNSLVIVGPMDSRQKLNIGAATLLSDLQQGQRLMIGEPNSVPVGIYAAEALRTLGLYETLTSNLIFGENTRAVLAWVERGETDLAIVYQTDALTSRKISVVDRLDKDLHTPIEYPAAALTGGKVELAQSFISFLRSETGQILFRRFGFLPLDVQEVPLDPPIQTP